MLKPKERNRFSSQSDRLLIFLHIPKAAGTTLNNILKRQFPPSALFKIDGGNVIESIKKFKNLKEEEKLKIKCLNGHMPFGLHSYHPSPSDYITILRDPVERIISHYYFVLRSPFHYLYKEVVSNKMSLDDYVRSELFTELENGQVRLLAGEEYSNSTNRDFYFWRRACEEAKKNINEHFICVGLSENFDASLLLFGKVLGWRQIWYSKKNITKNRPLLSGIKKDTIKAIEERNALDIELYSFAKNLFEDKLSVYEIKKSKVRYFQIVNGIYNKFISKGKM